MDEPSTTQATQQALPLWIRFLGWVSLPGTFLFAARLVYEETILTWREGPQMVGFSLAHLYSGLFLLFLLSALLSNIFLLCAVVVLCLRLIHRRRLPILDWFLICVVFVCVGLSYVPYSAWKLALAGVLGPGRHGSENLSLAAATGELRLVKTLVESGVPVDAPNSAGTTALNAACVGRQIEVARYLLARGADLKRAPECEWLNEATGKPARPKLPGTTVEVH